MTMQTLKLNAEDCAGKLNAEDRALYKTWRRNLIMFWSFVAAAVAFACTILAVDSTVTTEQRIEMALHSGMFP